MAKITLMILFLMILVVSISVVFSAQEQENRSKCANLKAKEEDEEAAEEEETQNLQLYIGKFKSIVNKGGGFSWMKFLGGRSDLVLVPGLTEEDRTVSFKTGDGNFFYVTDRVLHKKFGAPVSYAIDLGKTEDLKGATFKALENHFGYAGYYAFESVKHPGYFIRSWVPNLVSNGGLTTKRNFGIQCSWKLIR